MTNRVYDDEDNCPMSDEIWGERTVYKSRSEAEFYENGGYEAMREAKEARKEDE